MSPRRSVSVQRGPTLVRADALKRAAQQDYLAVMATNRALAVIMALVLASWASCAAALDRERAIDVAKREVQSKCSPATPCTFTAKLEKDKWYVRVEFTRRASPNAKPLPYPGGHAIFIINPTGKVVGRVERK